jgi:hypothetical protein
MRYRQIHLDFHTSERIPGIGSRFDPKAFAKTLSAANVDSITLFSKCHHGWSYHPTKVGKMHPELSFDLLRAQIDACHEAGINTPVYTTAVWDELAGREHPGWRVISPETGAHVRHRASPTGAGWVFMDLASPYLGYLCRQIEETVTLFPDANGIFIDICFQIDSVSPWVQTRMEGQGLDWTDKEHRLQFAEQVTFEFFERTNKAVRTHDPKMPVFYNFGHVRRGRRDMLKYFTHLEIESLPTSGWGYEHFPVSARYFEPMGIATLGMTGKFHNHWGEVGGYKTPAALFYECGVTLAQGAHVSIGDHLHPTGALDRTTYDAIGPAYAHVKACEPWAEGSKNLAEIGVISAEAASRPRLAGIPGHHFDADEGVVRVLLEAKLTFDLLDPDSDLTGYSLVILPDAIKVTAKLKAKIDAYVKKGGRVLLTGSSGIDPKKGFLFDVGARWIGPSPWTQGDYLMPAPDIRPSFLSDPLFMYEVAERIKVKGGKSLGDIHDPYFDRAPNHFSGHMNTPNEPDPSGYDAGSEKGRFTYLAHPVFTAYKRAGTVAMLEIAEKAIRRALGEPAMIATSLPRAGRATLRRQADKKRDVLHLLYATPVLRGVIRGEQVQPIQELTTLRGVAVDIAANGRVRGVRLVPNGKAVRFTEQRGRVRFTVPGLTGHQMVEINY